MLKRDRSKAALDMRLAVLFDGLLLAVVGARLGAVEEVVTLVLTGVPDPVTGLLLLLPGTAGAFVLSAPPPLLVEL